MEPDVVAKIGGLLDRQDTTIALLQAILRATYDTAAQPGTNTTTSSNNVVGGASIPVPLPVIVQNEPVDVNVTNTLTVAAQQSGTWNVGISGQPIGVNVQNTPTVSAQQSGSWTVSVSGEVDVTPASPSPLSYLPVRLTDGSSFYTATGGGGGGTIAQPTYFVYYDRITPAANKHLATLWNTSTSLSVMIQKILIYNFQETAVTGTAILGELRRITSHSGGTSVSILPADTADGLPTGVTAATGATATTSDLITRFVATGEEIVVAAAILQALLSVVGNVVYEYKPPQKPLTLRKNQGISLVQTTNTTVGSVSILIVFTTGSLA